MAWEQGACASTTRKTALVAMSVAVTAALAAAAHWIDFSNPYLPFAIGGAICFYLRGESSRREKLVWLAVSASFLAVARLSFQDWVLASSGVLCLLGFGAALMLGWRTVWSDHGGRKIALAQLGPAVGVVFFVFSAQHALGLANLLHPKVYDVYLFVADGSFGFEPSFAAGQLMRSSRVLAIIAIAVYLSLPMYMAFIYALKQPRNSSRPSWDIVTMLMLAGISGWALYNLVPATGPRYLLTGFPSSPVPYNALRRVFTEAVPMDAAIPRNAIPSLHMAWVLLLFWSSRKLSRVWRVVAATYAGITVFATLGTGEHYFVDLVTSLPFALMIKAVVSPDAKPRMSLRLGAVATGLAMTLGWLSLVRYGTKWLLSSVALPWALVVLTIAIVFYLEHRISSATAPARDAIAPEMGEVIPEIKELAVAVAD